MTVLWLALTDVSLAGPDLVPPIWRTAAALALVLAMLIGLGWLLRKSAQGRRHRRPLSIEAALALGERRSLAIVTVEGRRLLLGLAPNYVSLVTELTAAPSFDQAVATAITREVQP
jgi:flagellar biosynthetic protein FliO